MVGHLEIANLKGFAGHHRVRLAPLTLVYGANSAGKSSLIQALLLLKQSLEATDPEQPALVIRGSLVDLGSVPGILHGHDTSRELVIGVETGKAPRALRGGTLVTPDRIRFSFRWDDGARAVRQTGVTLASENDPIASFTRRRGPHQATRPKGGRSIDYPFRIGQRAAREAFVSHMLEEVRIRSGRSGRSWTDLLDDRGWLQESLVNRVTYGAGSFGLFPAYPDFVLRSADGERDAPLGELVREIELRWMNAAFNYRYHLLDTFESLVYLGPLRRPPQRFHVVSGAYRSSVGREGEYTAEILSRRQEIVDEVNRWLEQLDIPYSIDAIPVSEKQIRHSVGDVVVLVLTDKRSRLQVSPGDVGFGISQLLPIVVQVLVGGATTVCIEQPEIHVHPHLQANVADLFVKATQGPQGSQLVVETHSEHIMLRLLRRVREGSVSARSIQVLYVDVDSRGRSRVVEIPISDEGVFMRSWPRGFFEERLQEVFG